MTTNQPDARTAFIPHAEPARKSKIAKGERFNPADRAYLDIPMEIATRPDLSPGEKFTYGIMLAYPNLSDAEYGRMLGRSWKTGARCRQKFSRLGLLPITRRRK